MKDKPKPRCRTFELHIVRDHGWQLVRIDKRAEVAELFQGDEVSGEIADEERKAA